MHQIRRLSPTAVLLSSLLFITTQLQPTVGDKCEQFYRLDEQMLGRSVRIVSPNYPNSYPAYSNCSYHIMATRGYRIKLSILAIDLQVRKSVMPLCVLDKLDIFELNEDGQTEHFHRLCELNEPPIEINSVGNVIVMYFIALSDNRDQHRGFELTFEFFKAPQKQKLASQSDGLCPGPGAVRRPITGAGGVITSPGFPNHYYGNTECIWTIQVPRGQRVLLAFSYVYLGTRIFCTNQFVSIYEGSVSSFEHAGPQATLCGFVHRHDKDAREFLSITQTVTIRFVSGPERRIYRPKGAKNYEESGVQGFRLVWTAVALANGTKERQTFSLADNAAKWPGERGFEETKQERLATKITCAGFVCRGPVFCHDANQLLCEYLPKYCIDKSLECDNIAHCGTFDESDEDSCPGRIIAVSMYSIAAGIGIALIALGTVFVAWRSHIHRQRGANTSLRNDCITFLGFCLSLQSLSQQCSRIRNDEFDESAPGSVSLPRRPNANETASASVTANANAVERASLDHFDASPEPETFNSDTTRNFNATTAYATEQTNSNSNSGSSSNAATRKQQGVACVILQNPVYCDSRPPVNTIM